jgi:regulator of protease activity HflC (stomatin/prohibitin superfamily)
MGVVEPGIHPAIPVIDEIRIVDMRPQKYEASFDVLSQDNYPITMTVDIRYKVSNPEKAVINAPENFEKQADFLLKSEAGKTVCKNMKMDDVLKNRDDLGRSVKTFLDEHVSEWGINIETVQVKEVFPPSEVPVLQQELYETTMKNIIEPLKAEIEAKLTVIGADADAKAYGLRAEAKLKAMEKYFGIVVDAAGKIVKEYGAKEGRDIMYILFGKDLGYEHPITQKIKAKMDAEGMGEGAASAAESISADPRYTYLMTALQNIRGFGFFDIKSFKDLADLDKQLNKKLYPKS